MTEPMRIGFVGTGSMGAPIAANLIAAGHRLVVHDRRPAAVTDLVAAGARHCADLADLARHSDVVMLSLPSQVEVEQVCLGPEGILGQMRLDAMLVDFSTVSVALVRRLVDAQAAHGFRYLAAPVSQGVDNARLGALSIFVGGDGADVRRCRPLFDRIAHTVLHTGDQFSALAAKLLTNLLWYVNAAAIGEALLLGAKSGIAVESLRSVVMNSCGSSWVADHDIPSIYDGSFDPSFTLGLCRKDLRLIRELAAVHAVPDEFAELAERVFQRALDRYGPEAPELSVVRLLQESTGTDLQTGDRGHQRP
ncbi:MAG: NAD(P)-dependent oxidoreductase [Nocardioides sp.]